MSLSPLKVKRKGKIDAANIGWDKTDFLHTIN